MAALHDEVRQDASSLHRFICNTADQCDRRSGSATYLESTERFFQYVLELASSSKKYLQSTLDASTDVQEILDFRKEIATLRAGWKLLHGFIKPVVDADTLHLPTSLLQGLTNRVREMTYFADVDFVVYHTDQFNYFNVKLGILKPEANKIANLVGGPVFPERLGIIGIPYSQSSSLFMNCLIPHEMGHFVFGEAGLGRKFRSRIEKSLIAQFNATLSSDYRLQLVEIMAQWLEEIFCDCFAVRLVGFCFTLSFVELFDVATILDENGLAAPSGGNVEFNSYPPELFRLKQQVAILKADKWWNAVLALDSQYAKAVFAADKVADQTFTCPGIPNIASEVLSVFFGIMTELKSELDAVSAGLQDCTSNWAEQKDRIKEYLAEGVVPSTLIRADGAAPDIPSPVILLNAATEFYVQSLDLLLNNIDEIDQKSTSDRAYWVNRLELWTAKAIDDSFLLVQRR